MNTYICKAGLHFRCMSFYILSLVPGTINNEKNFLLSQVVPVYPSTHIQVKGGGVSAQVPPFIHGFVVQSSTSVINKTHRFNNKISMCHLKEF